MKNIISRRNFIQKSAWGAATTLTLPAFLQQTLLDLDARAATLPPQGGEGPILVIVEMGGGNDALNTVIPFSNAIYTGARPRIRIGEQHGIHQLGDAPRIQGGAETLALHPKMTGLRDLWNSGDLAIVNGVGYPNPNLSHFTSFDYWHSAEPRKIAKDGWIGRYFDNQCSGCEATQGIELAGAPTLAFKAPAGISPAVSFSDPDTYTWRDLATSGRETPLEDLYRKLIGLDHLADDGIDDTHDTLAFVQRAAHNAMISTANVRQAINIGGSLKHSGWDNSRLANDMKIISQLIQGGSQTSIYYAHQGGYDTHNAQISNGDVLIGRHSDLLRDLDGALSGFAAEMKAQGNWDRVVVMTLSEFGRKVIENGSSGTDHGAAESTFIMGGGVNGKQFYGQFPDLSVQARVSRDSLDFNVDFRTVYRTVLEKWMQVPPSAMGAIFPAPQPANFNPIAFL